MNPLPPCGVTAFAWLSCLGKSSWKRGSSAPSVSLEQLLSGVGLSSHEAALGIPGKSGAVNRHLAPLPDDLAQHESRCARLLFDVLESERPSIEEMVAKYGCERVALVLGSSTGGIDATELALREKRRSGSLPPDYRFEDCHPYHVLLTLAASVLGLRGPAFVISTACSSSGKALASAQRLLSSGLADAAIVCGVDALCEMTVRGFAGLGVLDDDTCRPFDAERSGISIGEGAALIVLDRETMGPLLFLGAGETSDAHHPTAPDPEGLGAAGALRACLTVAGLQPADISYLNAHGTGTPKNDDMEARAIQSVLGSSVPFSSTKDRTGHQLGAAGATEAVICLQSLLEGQAPQNRRPRQVDETLARQPTWEAVPLSAEAAALSNSFAFGGSNIALALRGTEADPNRCSTKHEPISMHVRSVSLWSTLAPNVPSWLRGGVPNEDQRVLPPAMILPQRARGRASLLTRALAEVYGQLKDQAEAEGTVLGEIPTIYSSSYGEMATTHELLDQIGEDLRLSPIRFQSSVHNTASGQISLATKNRAFSTAIAAGPESFAMALFEAQAWLSCHGGELFVLVGDEGVPEILTQKPSFAPLALGLHLSAARAKSDLGSLQSLRSSPRADSPRLSRHPARAERFSELRGSPPAFGLELIEALCEGFCGVVAVAPGCSVEVTAERHP